VSGIDTSGPTILARLTALYPKGIDLSLDRVRRLMADLGAPQDRLPPVIHVAGTNGKGSTIAFLRAMLEAAGRAVHVYTSPHLVRFNERIRLAGRLIEDAHLAELLAEVERVNAGRPITFFEVTTAAAFLAFARTPADAVLLETGLGGRLDATNLVARPAACALTPVSIDHVEFLGPTLPAIAAEKAGILKPGVPAAVAPQAAEALQVFGVAAVAVGAPLHVAGRDWRVEPLGDRFRYAGRRRLMLPMPALAGAHQLVNAATAIATLEAAGDAFALGEAAIRVGLRSAEWPARLQRLADGRLAALLPPWVELVLDGGHNESGGQALAAWAAVGARPLDVVLGMLATKPAADFLRPLGPFVRRLRTVAIPGEKNARPAAELAAAAASVGIADAAPAESVAAALEEFASEPPARLLICGSLYLAGRVLAENG
jgi:dihydrofolate synthase / folylpolyglutamate synthase